MELGHWLGVMIPRCADPVIAIRETAIEAVDDILMIDFYLMQVCSSALPSACLSVC